MAMEQLLPKKDTMKVKILSLGYVGRVVERGEVFLTVLLASGTRVICRLEMIAPI